MSLDATSTNQEGSHEIELGPGVYIYTGSPAAGKSHLCAYVLTQQIQAGLFDIVFVWSPSLGARGTGGDVFDLLIRNSTWKFARTMTDDDLHTLKKFALKLRGERNGVPPRICAVVDDSLGSKLTGKDGPFAEILGSWRHLGVTFHVISQLQKTNATSPAIRTVGTHVFLGYTGNHLQLESIRDSYCGQFESLREFKQWFRQQTGERFRFLLCRPQVYDDDEGKFALVKAPAEIPAVTIGRDVGRKGAAQHE